MSERPSDPCEDPERTSGAESSPPPTANSEGPGWRLSAFLVELKRRRVYRVAVVYALVAWLLLQLGDIVVDPLQLPEWTLTLVIVLLGLGFPIALVLAWAFDITPEGVRRAPQMRPDTERLVRATARPSSAVYAGMGVLAVAAGLGVYALLTHAPSSRSPGDALPDAPRFLAVLPFTNESADPDNEYFANGVTDDILAHLSLVPQFALVSRTTTMGYRATDKRVPEIAAELGVEYVLEGTVRKVDDHVRINARLVHGDTDRPLWGDTYDRRLEDIFALQTEIAREIVAALEVELAGGVAARMEQRPTADLEAYEDFLLARESFYRYDLAGTEQAIDFLRRALDRDPDFELARAWLGRSYVIYAANHGMGTAWADSAVAVSRRAALAQPDLPDALGALGAALAISGRTDEAVTALERALELNPSDWAAIGNLASAHARRGEWDESIRFTRRGLALEGARLTSPLHTNLAMSSLQLGWIDRAEAVVEPALALMPDHPIPVAMRAWIDFRRGDHAAAGRAGERLTALSGDWPSAAIGATELLLWAGDVERARQASEAAYTRSPTAYLNTHYASVLHGYTVLEAGESERAWSVIAGAERHAHERMEAGDEFPGLRYSLAAIHAMRGETDEAFRWLDEAIGFGWNSGWLTEADPLLEPLRGDPRFAAALARMERRVTAMRERLEREGL